MESKLAHNTENEVDLMVDTFIASRQNVRYQRLEGKETNRNAYDDTDEMSHHSLSTTAEENEFGLSEAFLHKWSNSNYEEGSSLGEDQSSLELIADLHLQPPNPHPITQGVANVEYRR